MDNGLTTRQTPPHPPVLRGGIEYPGGRVTLEVWLVEETSAPGRGHLPVPPRYVARLYEQGICQHEAEASGSPWAALLFALASICHQPPPAMQIARPEEPAPEG